MSLSPLLSASTLSSPNRGASRQRTAKIPPSFPLSFFFLALLAALTIWLGTGGLCNDLQDDSKYTNHSRNPALATASRLAELGVAVLPIAGGRQPDDDVDCFAARDIAAGEEITDDYGQYENPAFYVELCRQYDVEWAGRVAELYE